MSKNQFDIVLSFLIVIHNTSWTSLTCIFLFALNQWLIHLWTGCVALVRDSQLFIYVLYPWRKWMRTVLVEAQPFNKWIVVNDGFVGLLTLKKGTGISKCSTLTSCFNKKSEAQGETHLSSHLKYSSLNYRSAIISHAASDAHVGEMPQIGLSLPFLFFSDLN